MSAPGPAAAPGCLLARLADPRLGGAAPGLLLDHLGDPEGGGATQASAAAFPCCGGRGTRLPPGADVTAHCGLAARLGEARRVAARYGRLTAGLEAPPLAQAAGGAFERGVGERLHAIALGRATRGLALGPPTEAALAGASPLWTVALAAAWRFGLRVHVVVLGQTPPGEVLPRRDSQAPRLICLGNVDGLWEPKTADEFDAVVGFAYGAMTPVFMELVSRRPPPAAAASGATGRAFARRIAGMKARTPFAWLAPDCAGKVPAVTDGLGPLLARQGPASPGARPALLPWD